MREYYVKIFLFGCMVLFARMVSAQTVTNVTAEQVGKTIHVSYNLDKQADITLFFSTDGGTTYTQLFRVSGDVGKNVSAGQKIIVWDVLAEREKLLGENIVFKVRVDAPCGTVKDYDGNTYNTVQIGGQCWMMENMRTKHYADGTAIPSGESSTSGTSPYYYNYSDSGIPLEKRGYLYNWPAAMHGAASSNTNPSHVLGICPNGWHLPSDAEWTQLTDYVRSQSEYTCGGNSNFIAKALTSETGWHFSSNNCEVGNDLNANNATGFSAVPAGSGSRSFSNAGNSAHFWSATQYAGDPDYVYNRILYYDSADVGWGYGSKNNGFSVRCLRD